MSKHCNPTYHKGFVGIVTFDDTKETGVYIPGVIDPYPYNVLGVIIENNWIMIGKYTGHDSSIKSGWSIVKPDVEHIWSSLEKSGISELITEAPNAIKLITREVYDAIELSDLDTNFSKHQQRSLTFTPMPEKKAADMYLRQIMKHYASLGQSVPTSVRLNLGDETVIFDVSSSYEILLEKAGCPPDLQSRLRRMRFKSP